MQINNSMNQTNFGMALIAKPGAKKVLLEEPEGKIEELRKMAEKLKHTKYYDMIVGEGGYSTVSRNSEKIGYRGDVTVLPSENIPDTLVVKGYGLNGKPSENLIFTRGLDPNLIKEVQRDGSKPDSASRVYAATRLLNAEAVRRAYSLERYQAEQALRLAEVEKFVEDFA